MFKKLFDICKEFAIGNHLYNTSIKSRIIIAMRSTLVIAYEVLMLSTNKIHGIIKSIATYGGTIIGILWALH